MGGREEWTLGIRSADAEALGGRFQLGGAKSLGSSDPSRVYCSTTSTL